MDSIKKVKHHLQCYKSYQVLIKNLQDEIANAEAAESLINGSDAVPKVSRLSNAPGSDGLNHSEPENACIDKIDGAPGRLRRLQKARISLASTKLMVIQINRALDALEEEDRRLIYDRWVLDIPWRMVAKSQNLSRRQCTNRNNTILERMVTMMFGEETKEIY